MNISFEIEGDSVGVNDLIGAINVLPEKLSARIVCSLTLGKYGPRPSLMVVFDAIPDNVHAENLTNLLAHELYQAGIEVANG